MVVVYNYHLNIKFFSDFINFKFNSFFKSSQLIKSPFSISRLPFSIILISSLVGCTTIYDFFFSPKSILYFFFDFLKLWLMFLRFVPINQIVNDNICVGSSFVYIFLNLRRSISMLFHNPFIRFSKSALATFFNNTT